MDDIYVIYVSNNLDPELESHEENEIGYAKTEQEAKNACERFEEEKRKLEKKDIYAGCHDIGGGSYFYKKVKRL